MNHIAKSGYTLKDHYIYPPKDKFVPTLEMALCQKTQELNLII